jgi:hypothetical protein
MLNRGRARAAPLLLTVAAPNFVFVLVDDLRWDALTGLLGEDAQHRSHRRRNMTFPMPVAAAVFPLARQLPHRPHVHHHGVNSSNDNLSLKLAFPALLEAN